MSIDDYYIIDTKSINEKERNMKRNIGSKLCLYPTPLGVVGTKVDGKNDYVLVGHF